MKDLRNGTPRVEVEWIDSTSEDSWQDEATVLAATEQDGYGLCLTVGYQVGESDDWLYLAGSLATNGPRSRNTGHFMAIPKVAVTRKRVLR